MPIHHLTVGDLSCTVLNDTQTPFVYDPATTDLVGVTWDEIRAALDALGQVLHIDVTQLRKDLLLAFVLRIKATEPLP